MTKLELVGQQLPYIDDNISANIANISLFSCRNYVNMPRLLSLVKQDEGFQAFILLNLKKNNEGCLLVNNELQLKPKLIDELWIKTCEIFFLNNPRNVMPAKINASFEFLDNLFRMFIIFQNSADNFEHKTCTISV